VHYIAATDVLNEACDGEIVTFNDSHTHAEVIAVFDRAIARAEGEAA